MVRLYCPRANIRLEHLPRIIVYNERFDGKQIQLLKMWCDLKFTEMLSFFLSYQNT